MSGSFAGRKDGGIRGSRSSLVSEAFRLAQSKRVRHIVLENVPFMLRLHGGRAMRVIVDELEQLGFNWGYRVLDSIGFGVAQRRRRVFVLASRDRDVKKLLFPNDRFTNPLPHGSAYGFYWTEGTTGLGWAEDAIPALKCGSGLGIPSPPAMWFPTKGIFTPTIEDAEALQGFRRGWTQQLEEHGCGRRRWALVGNAVTVPVARWIARRLLAQEGTTATAQPMRSREPWPNAAYGDPGQRPWRVECSEKPLGRRVSLVDTVKPSCQLSERATRGFYSRLMQSTLRRPAAFDRDLAKHIKRMATIR